MQTGLMRLYIFYLVARHGSMKKAADILYVSPPAVTMQIKKMENELGVPLFGREHGVLSLTERGRGLYARVEPMFEHLPAVDRYIGNMMRNEESILLLGTHHVPGKYFIPDLIGHVRARYPELDVRMELGTQSGLLDMLRQRQLDCALIVGEPPKGFSCRTERLFAVELVLVTAWPGLFGDARRVSMRELEGVPIILQQQGGGARRAVLACFERSGIQPVILLDNLSSDIIKQFLPKHKAIACISRFVVQEDIERGLLREIQVDEGLPPIPFHIICRDAESPHPQLEKFLDGIKGFVPPFAMLP